MMSDLWDLLRFAFVRRAIVAGVAVALSCGLLGVPLVLRRQAMLGDGLAHFAFGAVGLALLLGQAPLAVVLPMTLLASLLIFLLPERAGPYTDAVIGMVSATGVAIGVLLASLGGGFSVDLFSFLFGDLLAVTRAELALALLLALVVVAFVAAAHRELLAITLDETAARTFGVDPALWRRALALMTAVVIVLGIRIVGTLLVSSLLIFPAMTALQGRRSFVRVLVTAPVIGAVTVVVGLAAMLIWNLPAGATIVIVNLLFFIAALVRRILGA